MMTRIDVDADDDAVVAAADVAVDADAVGDAFALQLLLLPVVDLINYSFDLHLIHHYLTCYYLYCCGLNYYYFVYRKI